MPKSIQLKVLNLEAREVPAVFGQPWVDSATLGVSLVPDGTSVAGVPSQLGSLFGNGSTWKNEIRRAFQTWSDVSNLNFSWRDDSGVALGNPLPLQGDPKNGDIRISARPLSADVLAITNPFDLLSNWSGEIILNSNVSFRVGSSSTGTYDLYTVMLQEIGHSIGIGNNPTDTTSVMFETYQTARTGLATSDVQAVRSLYGVRQADSYEGATNNDDASRATQINYVTTPFDANMLASVSTRMSLITADISSQSDVDLFRFLAPSKSSSPQILLQIGENSFLRGAVRVIDTRTNQVVLSRESSTPGGNLLLNLRDVPGGFVPNREYLVRVEAVSTSSYRVGRYQLIVGNKIEDLTDDLDFSGFAAPDRAIPLTVAGSTISSSADLGVARSLTDGRWDFFGKADFYSSSDIDVYRVTSGPDSGSVMVAAVWTDGTTGAIPRVRVTDAAGNTLQARVLRQDNTVALIQIQGVLPSTSYFVHVSQVGTFKKVEPVYWMGVDFRSNAIESRNLASGQLTSSQSFSQTNLTITRSQLMRFEVSAFGSPNSVRMEVLDSTNTVRFSMLARSGETQATNLFFMPGTFQVRFSGVSASTAPFTSVNTTIRFTPLTDPIGPELLDPIGSVVDPNAPQSPPPPPNSPPPPPLPSGDPTGGFGWDPTMLVDPLAWWW